MTENEAIEIIEKIFPKWNGDSKWLSIDNMQKIINSYTKVLNEIQKYREPWENEFLADMKSNHVETLSELRQYRNLGTIEFLTDMKSNYVEVLSDLRQYQNLGTVKELKELTKNKLSGLELAEIYAAVQTLKKYQEIGTVEECQEARENKWILCSERLPEEPEKIPEDNEELEQMYLEGKIKEYIVTIKDASVSTTLHYIGKNEWIDILTLERYEVIAWQQLPGPYQERKE